MAQTVVGEKMARRVDGGLWDGWPLSGRQADGVGAGRLTGDGRRPGIRWTTDSLAYGVDPPPSGAIRAPGHLQDTPLPTGSAGRSARGKTQSGRQSRPFCASHPVCCHRLSATPAPSVPPELCRRAHETRSACYGAISLGKGGILLRILLVVFLFTISWPVAQVNPVALHSRRVVCESQKS
jgi:hypothetical protein